MNKPYRLIADHEANLWMTAAWLQVVQIQQRPRQVQAAAAAHHALDSFLSPADTPQRGAQADDAG